MKLEKLRDFKHLGTILTEDNDVTTDVKKRIVMTYKTNYEVKKQLNSPNLTLQTKYTYVI